MSVFKEIYYVIRAVWPQGRPPSWLEDEPGRETGSGLLLWLRDGDGCTLLEPPASQGQRRAHPGFAFFVCLFKVSCPEVEQRVKEVWSLKAVRNQTAKRSRIPYLSGVMVSGDTFMAKYLIDHSPSLFYGTYPMLLLIPTDFLMAANSQL